MNLHNRFSVNMFLCRLVPVAILLIVLEADSTVLAQTVSHPGFMLRKAEGTLKRERGQLVNRLAKLEKAQAVMELLDSQLNALASEEAKLKVSMEAYPEILRSLQTQRVQLMIDLAGIDAKRAKMVELMSGDKSKSTRAAALGPLMEMVDIQTKHLQRLEQIEKEGRPVDPAQVHAVRMSILSTRLKVEQEAARKLQPNHLNEMALDLTLDRAEKKARMERTEGLLNEIFDSRSVLMARKKLVEQRVRILGRLSSLEVAVEEQREEVESREMDLKRMQEEMEAGQDE